MKDKINDQVSLAWDGHSFKNGGQDQRLRMKDTISTDMNAFYWVRYMANNGIKKYIKKARGLKSFVCICIKKW